MKDETCFCSRSNIITDPASQHQHPFIDPLPHINVQRFRGGLVFKAHRLLYHSALGLRVMKKKKRSR